MWFPKHTSLDAPVPEVQMMIYLHHSYHKLSLLQTIPILLKPYTKQDHEC